MIKTLSCGGAKFQAWSNAEWKWATTAAIGACRREMLGIDKLSVFLSNYWLLVVLLLLVPSTLLIYKKRNVALRLLTPLMSRLPIA
ncbi:hypothetical protein MUP07_05815 [Candidatus Bathyarchaeota archaeon]|jgi:hypothetical protein|nr:hypothetical protein [Candidatus Bathyarchaeota archaeon]